MARRQKKRTSSVTEAGGFKLILSKRNATCYYGVAEVSNRFKASLSRQGQNVYLGKFGTTVEAAIAVSRFLQKETEGEEDDDEEDGNENEDDEQELEQDDELETEAEGLQLHLSDNSATGYKCVYETRSKRFEVRADNTYLGCFETAVEAAVCYARHVQQCGKDEDEEQTSRR